MPQRIRTALLTDNRLLGDAFKSVLRCEPGFYYIGAVEPDPVVLKRLPTMRPTVIVVDTGIDRDRFMEAMQALQAIMPAAQCLGLNISPNGDTVIRCADAGIKGFVMRDAGKDEIVEAIRAISLGQPVVPAPVAGELIAYITQRGNGKGNGRPDPLAVLSRREREIVAGLDEGLTNKEIAQRLNIAPFTVKNHVHNILVKLSLHSRHQVARKATSVDAAVHVPPSR